MPGIISRLIVEPAGGQNVAGDSVGDNCDKLLQNQLVFQRGASTAGRMNEVIRQIQAQRDNAVDSSPGTAAVIDDNGTPLDLTDDTITTPATNPSHASCGPLTVGDGTVPRGLTTTGAGLRVGSGRDSSNNIIIYFSATNLPSDSAMCRLYVSRLNNWSEGL